MTSTDSRDTTATTYDAVAVPYADALPDDSYEADLDRAVIADFAQRIAMTVERRVLDAGWERAAWRPRLSQAGCATPASTSPLEC